MIKKTRVRRRLAACTLALLSSAAFAEQLKIGFVTDMSGPFSDIDGARGAEAIRMAIADFGGTFDGKPIQLLTIDHQNKADIGASKVREWIDSQKIQLILGGTNSAVALAVNKVAADTKTVYINNGAGVDSLTTDQCTPYTIHYAYDTVAMAKGTAAAVTKAGGNTWFFLSSDFAFGKALEARASSVATASGGKVVGTVRHPLAASDFASFMLQAKSSKAKVFGLATAGSDMINAIKAAKEFGVSSSMKVVPLLAFISDINTLGLDVAQGMYLTDSWYWNQSPRARQWSDRFFAINKVRPTSVQAANYSSTMNYLQVAKALGTTDSDKVMAALKSRKIDDFYAKGYVRPDGRMVHDMYLMEVKKPSESEEPWDYYRLVATIPGEEAFTTKAESTCRLWK
ncbi:urea ABC transporter, urea binding protein [compost metagenome]